MKKTTLKVDAKPTVGAGNMRSGNTHGHGFTKTKMQPQVAGNLAVQNYYSDSKSSAQLLNQRQVSDDMQQKRADTGAANKFNNVDKALGSPTTGAPLSSVVRKRIEPVLRADLSHVRVHSDSQSQRAAGDINARAFTHNQHIWLGQGQSSSDLALMAHEATHTVQENNGVIRRWGREKPIKLKSAGLASRWSSLKIRLEREFRQNAKKELDRKIAAIKVQGAKVVDLKNKIKILQLFQNGENWGETEKQQLASLQKQLKPASFILSELKERAVELAVIAYRIETDHVANIIVPGLREDEEQQQKDRVHGIMDSGGVMIFHSAFQSASLLGSVIGHESEVHARQYTEGRDYDDEIGFILNEIEALDYEINEAGRYGLSAAEIEEIHDIRTKEMEKLQAISPAYADRARQGNYDL